ncbi:Outer membrane protein (OmpH-like) [compost metagenome]
MTQEMNAVILDRVKKAVNIVATAKKFNYIIDESTTLYSAGGVDVTNEVIVELMKLEAVK